MSDLYALRGRALRARLLEIVTQAYTDGDTGTCLTAPKYAERVVPPVPTRRRTRQWLCASGVVSTPLCTLSWHSSTAKGHRYELVLPNGDRAVRNLLDFLGDGRVVESGKEEAFAALCIDLSTNPDEDLE